MVEPVSLNPIPLNANPPIRNKNSNKTAIMIGAGVIVALLIISGLFKMRQPQKSDLTPTPLVETKTPTPTEKPNIDKSTVKIQVVNGTGTPGQAGTVVDALKTAGYVADNITTANAEEFADIISNIAAKDGFDAVANDIETTLKAILADIKIDSTSLDKDSEYDIVVTTGGKKYEEPTPTTGTTLTPNPTASPTPTPTP